MCDPYVCYRDQEKINKYTKPVNGAEHAEWHIRVCVRVCASMFGMESLICPMLPHSGCSVQRERRAVQA